MSIDSLSHYFFAMRARNKLSKHNSCSGMMTIMYQLFAFFIGMDEEIEQIICSNSEGVNISFVYFIVFIKFSLFSAFTLL